MCTMRGIGRCSGKVILSSRTQLYSSAVGGDDKS